MKCQQFEITTPSMTQIVDTRARIVRHLGAASTVKWSYCKTTLEAMEILKQKNYKLFAVEQAENSIPLNNFVWKKEPIALVFGNEVYGVEQEVINSCEGVIEIPQTGTKHSFNISVSVGIVLWKMLRDK